VLPEGIAAAPIPVRQPRAHDPPLPSDSLVPSSARTSAALGPRDRPPPPADHCAVPKIGVTPIFLFQTQRSFFRRKQKRIRLA
jgi:hypothetical protein